MNKQLEKIYQEYFLDNKLLHDEEVLQFSMPFLLNADTSYNTSNKRVMIVGQETFEWYAKYVQFLSQENPIEYAKNIYTEFLKSESQNYKSPFWDYLNKLFENTSATWIWNNAFKMETVEYLSDEKFLGKKVSLSVLSKNKVHKHLIDKIKILQRDVFLKELEILKPDIVIFFTGNPYDSLFMDWQFDTSNDFYQDIPEAVEMGIDKWKFGRLNSPLLPINTFRTYHPNYLRRVQKGIINLDQKEFIFKYLENIISE